MFLNRKQFRKTTAALLALLFCVGVAGHPFFHRGHDGSAAGRQAAHSLCRAETSSHAELQNDDGFCPVCSGLRELFRETPAVPVPDAASAERPFPDCPAAAALRPAGRPTSRAPPRF